MNPEQRARETIDQLLRAAGWAVQSVSSVNLHAAHPIRQWFESHYAQKDFRTRAVCFVDAPGQWNKAHVQFLEANPARQSCIRNVATASRQLACRP